MHDLWMVDERLWQKDYDKKANPKNILSAGGDTSSACADVRFIPVFFTMPCPFAYSLLVLDIHQYPPPPINPFWISHPLWRPTQLHLPATLMAFSHIRQLIKSKFQWWINVALADAPERLLLLSINVLPERLCPAGMYDIMRSIRRPSWVTRPPIAQSQFFFDSSSGVDGQFTPTRVFEWMPTIRKQPIFTMAFFFFFVGHAPKTYCKCMFVRPSCACRPVLKCQLKGWLTKLRCVQHEDDLPSRCLNEVPIACWENDTSQSGMWKAVTFTKGYDIVKISGKCHTPIWSFKKWRVAIGVMALDYQLVHKNSMQRSTAVAMETNP